MRRVAGLVALAGAALALAACSQIAAIAPVGGGPVAMTRFATIDVLLTENVEILDAPTCVQQDKTVTCSGTTVDGEAITATSSTADDGTIEITVGSETLYSGSLTELLEKYVRSGS